LRPSTRAQGESDHVIPRELLDCTRTYLLSESRAPTVAQRQPGGHQLTKDTAQQLAAWIAHRLAFVAEQAATLAGPRTGARWPGLPDRSLPERPRPRPEVSCTIPQQQRSQNAPARLQEELYERIRSLPGVDAGPSRISVPGARGFTLPRGAAGEHAFLVPKVGEFAHLHPVHNGSLHVALPPDMAADVSTMGWGRSHMWAGTRLSPGFTLIYGPRDDDELTIVHSILKASHTHAAGAHPPDAAP